MMDPTSNPVNTSTTTEQPQLPNNRSAQPPPPPYTSLTLQQQQNLALQWLEQQQQQQQEHQQRQSLNQAILVAAAAQQQDQPQLQPQNVLLNSIGSAISPLTSSSTTDVRNHQQYLLEVELRRQILLQQQRLLQTNNNIPLQLDNSKSLLQDRLLQLLSTNQESTTSAVPATVTSGSSINIATSDVDRIMAAETLLQRNRLQEAIRMLQIQGVLQEDNALRRTVNNNRDSNVFATSSLLLSNDPITPHTLGQATVTNSSMSQLLQPGILTMGQMETKVPHTNVAIGDTDRSSSKRKSDSTHSTTRTKEMMPKKLKSKETRNENLSSSFPLPSMKKARRLTMTFKSFQDVWDELESIPLQKEIFIRRLYKYDCKLVD